MNSPGIKVKGSIAVKIAVALALGAALPARAADKKPAPKPVGDVATQSIMHSIFEPLSAVLPLSFDYEAFTATANRAKIQKQLKTLSDNAQNLERHSTQKERGFEFVAKSLAFDAKRLIKLLLNLRTTTETTLRDRILALDAAITTLDQSIATRETELNAIIYQLYQLTPEEITMFEAG